jgi:hypothetical protein
MYSRLAILAYPDARGAPPDLACLQGRSDRIRQGLRVLPCVNTRTQDSLDAAIDIAQDKGVARNNSLKWSGTLRRPSGSGTPPGNQEHSVARGIRY